MHFRTSTLSHLLTYTGRGRGQSGGRETWGRATCLLSRTLGHELSRVQVCPRHNARGAGHSCSHCTDVETEAQSSEGLAHTTVCT